MFELSPSAAIKLSALHSAVTSGWSPPLFPRLMYTAQGRFCVDHRNEKSVCAFADYLHSLGAGAWVANPDMFDATAPSTTIATVDRYGLPIRTEYSPTTGLMRSDPYYSKEVLETLYGIHYRSIYSVPYTHTRARFLSDQVLKGTGFLEFLGGHNLSYDSVLDYGCGMGGMLVPFVQAGKRCVGCDLGSDFLRDGRMLGLDLYEGGVDVVRDKGPFDLILLSHVLEHVPSPRPFLQSLLGILSERGHLLIEVPGIRSISGNYQGNILQYLQNAHPWHFTKSTLARLLQEVGFRPVHLDDTVRAIATRVDGVGTAPVTEANDNTMEFLTQTELEFETRHNLVPKLRRRLGLLKQVFALPKGQVMSMR